MKTTTKASEVSVASSLPMSKAQKFIGLINQSIVVIASFATIIAAIFTVILFFHSTVIVTHTQGISSCDGFLIQDVSVDVLLNTIPNQKEKGYLENKINCYRDQIQKNPNDAAAYTNIGEAERRLGNLEVSLKAHRKALELKQDLQAAQIGLALVEQDLGNKLAAQQTIQGALAQNPNALTYLYQGVILHMQNDLQGAEAAWRKAKMLEPRMQRFLTNKQLFSLKRNGEDTQKSWSHFFNSFRMHKEQQLKNYPG